MIIKSISLTNFRNYGRLDLKVGPSVNVIYGNNAQGKTNIIEAVSVGSSVYSHRTTRDREMVKFGENEYSVELLCHDEVYDSDIELKACYYTEKSEFTDKKTAGRVLYQDGIAVPRISRYMSVCNTVIFAPEDLNIVKGQPAGRRRYLNLLICKVSPSYYDTLGKARRLIEQKNACLKSFKGHWDPAREAELDYWDFSIADLSAELIMERMRYCELISRKASAHHSVISDGKEVLKVNYCTLKGAEDVLRGVLDSDELFGGFIEGTLSEGVLARLKACLSEFILSKMRNERIYDVEKGICSNGVHRDDLDISLNSLPMRSYSSQGQQRSAALSLKLAELEIIKERTHSSPILLLDDVFSELDEGRRVSLLSGMDIAQIFITCTDRSFVESELSGLVTGNADGSRDIRFFRVQEGKVFCE